MLLCTNTVEYSNWNNNSVEMAKERLWNCFKDTDHYQKLNMFDYFHCKKWEIRNKIKIIDEGDSYQEYIMKSSKWHSYSNITSICKHLIVQLLRNSLYVREVILIFKLTHNYCKVQTYHRSHTFLNHHLMFTKFLFYALD